MKIRSGLKIGWLAYVNFGLGLFSFTTGLVPLFLLISFLLGSSNSISFNRIGENYFNWMLDSPEGYLLSWVGFLLGLATLVIGLVASVFIQEKLQRGIAFIGNILSTFGVMGNLVTMILGVFPRS